MTLLSPGDPETRAHRLAEALLAEHETSAGAPGDPGTVVTLAPGRVNLIGEHTDYNHGLCLPLALPHATCAAARLRGDGQVRLSSAQQDDTWSGGLGDLGPGRATGWAAYAAGVVWALAEQGLAVPGLDLRVESTVPVGAGLSSSAALECAVAVAVVTLLGHDLDDDLRDVLAQACIRAETEVARAPTGGMDQTVALRGRAEHAVLLDFAPDGLPLTREVPLELAAAGLALLVTDTRVSHALVDGGYGDRREECRRAAELLGVASLRDADLAGVEALDDDLLRARARHVVTEDDRVVATVAALEEADHEQVGSLMRASHASMRDDFAISCAELDLVVETAVGAGALGSRMTGGGFGGSTVSLVRRDDLVAVAEAVDAAFAAAGLRAPVHLEATASPGARVVLGAPTVAG